MKLKPKQSFARLLTNLYHMTDLNLFWQLNICLVIGLNIDFIWLLKSFIPLSDLIRQPEAGCLLYSTWSAAATVICF